MAKITLNLPLIKMTQITNVVRFLYFDKSHANIEKSVVFLNESVESVIQSCVKRRRGLVYDIKVPLSRYFDIIHR